MNTLPLTFAAYFLAGDDKPFIVRWKNDDLTPIDLTGYTAKMQFKTDKCGAVALEILGVIAVPATGEIIFPFSGAQKQALIADCLTTCYHYDIELTQPGGDILTLLRGRARFEEDVTE